MRKFEFYWKEINIGFLLEINWDMRSFGDIIFKFDYLVELFEDVCLVDLIKYFIMVSNYLEEGDEENYNRMCEIEIKYFDLIESLDWKLLNEKGEIVKIFCLIFYDNNEVIW